MRENAMHSRRNLREERDINSALTEQCRKQPDFGTPLGLCSVTDLDLSEGRTPWVHPGGNFQIRSLLGGFAMGYPQSCLICGTDEMFFGGGLAPPSASGLTFDFLVQPAGSGDDPLFHLSHILGEG